MTDTYRTDDLLLAAFLLTQNVRLLNVLEDYPNHFFFELSETDKCENLKIQFLNNATAPARELFSKREMLISEIKMKNQDKKKYVR